MKINLYEKMLYNSYARYLTNKLGYKIKKISIDAGFTCPNKDGTRGRGGCIFCSEKSYTPFCTVKNDIETSIKNQLLSDKYRYIAYFQTNTNTYASKEVLISKYDSALNYSPLIIGLNIGTRSDCFYDYVYDLIVEYAKKTYLTIDIGIESIYDDTLTKVNRCHNYQSVLDTLTQLDNFKKEHNIDFDVCGHIIIGFPWETYDEQMAYVNEMNRLPIQHLKINNLQLVNGTKLYDMYLKGKFHLYTSEEYIHFLAEFLSYLSPDIVIQRLTAYTPDEVLMYPRWDIEKFEFYKRLNEVMIENNLCQGSRFKK
jgi:radical SAM protein (TIGR01212 family)